MKRCEKEVRVIGKAYRVLVPLVVMAVCGMVRGQTTTAADDPIVRAVAAVDRDLSAFKTRQFVAYDPTYVADQAARMKRIRELGKQVFAGEKAGRDIQLAHLILIDAYWMISATADFKRADSRLDDLEKVLAAPEAANGIVGSIVWYQSLDGAYDKYADDKKYVFPAELIDRINSPEKLRGYFTSVMVSDIEHEGVDHGEELNEPMADLVRMILRGIPEGYPYDPKLKETLLDVIMNQLRDPTTGYWGERYRVDGKVLFVPDLSMTFHIVSYLEQDKADSVEEMEKVVATTLALKDRDTPVGWLHNGEQYNHNAMDVIDLFKWGWPHASAGQRAEMAVEIQKMIDRCLHESLQADGSFKHLGIDSSIEEATYFGGAFLARTGFFDKAKRFWTDRDFPEAAEVKERVTAFIKKNQPSGATGGGFYASALRQMNSEE